MINTTQKTKILTTLSLLPLAISQITMAEPQVNQIEEIMVTAERRSESIQDVPVTVTALSSDMMENRQIFNVLDLQASVPNLVMAANTGTVDGARIFLRGIGEDESRVTVDPAIAMYVDGVYVGRQIGAMFDLVDIERIEVLRGPQGTLYGRNANGGAIKLVSKKPDTQENAAKAKLTYGSESRLDLSLSGNLAVSDQLALQGAIMDKRRDGFYKTTNNVEIGEIDSSAIRLAALYNTSNDIEFLLTYDRFDSDSDPIPASILPEEELAAGYDGDVFTLDNALFPAAGVFGNPDPDTIYHNETNQDGLSLAIAFDLGGYSITSLTARRTMENSLSTIVVNEYTQEVDQSQFSQEFQISSNYDGAVNWIGGLFYYTEDVEQQYYFFSTDYDMNVESESLAIFGQVTFDISEKLGLSLGGRYTTEDKEFAATCSGSFTASGCLLTAFNSVDTDETFSNADYKLSLTYDLLPEVMLFSSLTTGFKSGAWSPDNFYLVKEETVTTFEAGIKSDWLDKRLRLNATYFFNDYKDLQIAGRNSLGFTRFNVPEVETSGVELEIVALPLPELEISANIGYLDTEYVDVPADVIAAGTILSEGAAMKNAPQWNAGVSTIYSIPLNDMGALSFGIDIAYETESYSALSTPESTKRDDTILVNARVNWKSVDNNWQVALWGKNLEDEVYYPSSSLPYVYVGEPRTYGIDITYRM